MTAKLATRNTKRETRTHFTIDVFPHIKKFIHKNYLKTRQGEAIKVEEYKTLGTFITLALLDNRPRAEFNGQYRDRLTEKLSIILTSEQAKMSPRLGKLLRINLHMDRLFKEHMICWVNALKIDGIPPFTALRMFLDYYQLDENEYGLNTAHQHYKREMGIVDNKSQNVVPKHSTS